jgi:RES domain-containing protein
VTVAWRLVKERHRHSAFDGEGARRAGGRWNHQGIAVVYVSDSLALAALEAFVHLGKAATRVVHVVFRVEVPEHVAVEVVAPSALPRNWRSEPPRDTTKQVGTDWVRRGKTAVLRVPSVIIPNESNYALNPAHPDFQKVVISRPEPFYFDPRMWK